MFVSRSGVKAHYYGLTLLAVAEFDEWKVMVYGQGVMIHGARQFGEEKAKEHALTIAQQYVHQEKKEDVPVLSSVDWSPAGHDEWLSFRP